MSGGAKFRNPANGYVEEVRHAGLWCLLFGFVYLAIKGVWAHAVASFVLALLTIGLSWFVYPFFAQRIVERSYLQRGWVRVGGEEPNEREFSAPPLGSPANQYRRIAAWILGLLALAIVTSRFSPPSTSGSASSQTAANANDRITDKGADRNQFYPDSVILLDLSWRRGGFDTVMIATFTIVNKNDFAIKDIAVACQLTAPSGTAVGYTGTTIYDIVPAHGQKKFPGVNMGSGYSIDFKQAESAACKIGKLSRD